MRIAAFFGGLLLAASVSAAEDFRVMKLEQDMRGLEREVQSLKQQLFALQQRTSQGELVPSGEIPREPPQASEARWLKIAAWERVRTGMSELETIEILGTPNAVRPDANGRRALLYTLEIGTTGFLSGAVVFAAGKVVAIQRPTLK